MMPLAAKIVFTVILCVSIVSSLFKNYCFVDDPTRGIGYWDDSDWGLMFLSTAISWAWRITLIVFFWAF